MPGGGLHGEDLNKKVLTEPTNPLLLEMFKLEKLMISTLLMKVEYIKKETDI